MAHFWVDPFLDRRIPSFLIIVTVYAIGVTLIAIVMMNMGGPSTVSVLGATGHGDLGL